MGSQLQNPDFRNNPENFHPCDSTKISCTGSLVFAHMCEGFQDYSWFQDFEADFPMKISLKYWIVQITINFLIYFQFI